MGRVLAVFTIVWAALWWGWIVVVLMSLTGCMPMLGIKSYQNGDMRIDAITGWGAEVSVSGTDTLDNNRAIRPSGNGYQAKGR